MASDSKVQKLVEEISNLSVLELSELVSTLQEKLGVNITAPSVAATSPAAPAPDQAEQQTQSTSASLTLIDAGANKIGVIKALREIKPDLGLKEAKEITESTPKQILANVKNEEAQAAAKKLQEAGAKVEVK